MGLMYPEKVLFEGPAPDIQRIAAKVAELSGLAVRIRQTVYHNTAEFNEADGVLAFECAPREEIWLSAPRAGAEMLPYWVWDRGEKDPPGKHAVYLSLGGLEPTLKTYIRLALQALGGEAKHPLDEASRRLCAGPITELELERRKWAVSGKQLLATLISGITEPFYIILEACGIKFPHRPTHRAMPRIPTGWMRIAMFPFELLFFILGAIIMVITVPLLTLYLSVTFAGKTARLAFHLLTQEESAQAITPEQAEDVYLTAAEKSARNILNNMRKTYGAPEEMIPADAAEFGHLDLRRYRRFRADMEAQGYKYIGDFEIRVRSASNIAKFARTMIRIMVSEDGSITTNYYQFRQNRWPLFKALAAGLFRLHWVSAPKYFAKDIKTRYCVGFDSEFDDGRYLITSNATSAGKITMPPAMEQHYFPYGTPTPVLLEAHRKRLQEILLESPGIKPLAAATTEDILQAHDRLSAQKSAYRASVRWITQDELRAMSNSNHAYADEVYIEVQKLLEREAAEADSSNIPPEAAS
jgi:hypothetical protein